MRASKMSSSTVQSSWQLVHCRLRSCSVQKRKAWAGLPGRSRSITKVVWLMKTPMSFVLFRKFLHGLHQAVEGLVHRGFPLLHPLADGSEGLGPHSVGAHPPRLLRQHDAAVLQYLEMLEGRRQ